jgi:hypothetical protein
LSHRLLERFPSEHLVVAFDADESGQAGQHRLGSLLDEAGVGDRASCLEVPRRWGDLNGWLQGTRQGFDDELGAALGHTLDLPDLGPELAGTFIAADVGLIPEPTGMDMGP